MPRLRFDEIGYWSEVKIEIVKEYAKAYSTVIKAQPQNFRTVYIDAFAGPGKHFRKRTRETIEGSPIAALGIEPAFDEYYFIDIVSEKIDYLERLIGTREKVYFMKGDANIKLIEDVFPKSKYSDYKRALCLLDPYGLHLDWKILEISGAAKSIEIFLNFPVADMNRNVFWKNPEGVSDSDIFRMTRFWGDESWRSAAYTTETTLFQFEERTDNETIAEAFRMRLKNVAGFSYVPEPIPMRNDQGAVVYYLFFASPNENGAKIATSIFKKYRNMRA
ncbi:MAG: three-Cys-motif partner protein TcmP [Rhodospirillales bacterium]